MPLYVSPITPIYKTGTGTYAMVDGPVTTAAIPAVDKVYLYPFILYAPITFTAGQMRVGTGGAGSSIKVAIWANGTGATNRPVGAPLFVDNTGVATTSSATNIAPALAGSLSPGIYWAGSKLTGTLPQMVIVQTTNLTLSQLTGASGSALVTCGLSSDDSYANSMPTFAEGASFTLLGTASAPVLGLTV